MAQSPTGIAPNVSQHTAQCAALITPYVDYATLYRHVPEFDVVST